MLLESSLEVAWLDPVGKRLTLLWRPDRLYMAPPGPLSPAELLPED